VWGSQKKKRYGTAPTWTFGNLTGRKIERVGMPKGRKKSKGRRVGRVRANLKSLHREATCWYLEEEKKREHHEKHRGGPPKPPIARARNPSQQNGKLIGKKWRGRRKGKQGLESALTLVPPRKGKKRRWEKKIGRTKNSEVIIGGSPIGGRVRTAKTKPGRFGLKCLVSGRRHEDLSRESRGESKLEPGKSMKVELAP